MMAVGIDYDRTGEGEPLLLLHGTGGSRRHWRPVFDELSRHHDVIAADLPGHGGSDAPPAHGDHSPVGYAARLADFLNGLGIAAPTSPETRSEAGRRWNWPSRATPGR
jgi:pimeloyl-ACP methyl ester carboxylesterase